MYFDPTAISGYCGLTLFIRAFKRESYFDIHFSSSGIVATFSLALTFMVEGIDTSFSVMAVTPQTPKCHHNRGAAKVVVTFGSLWCHSHDRKRGINFYSIMVPQN